MRADRLLSLLMLLQTRGRMTAAQLADELEVSERTIYRDMDALSIAGVPVYGEPGPEGGYALVESYRTNLTGLNEAETRALFMLSVPAPLTELGVTGELKAALRKLAAAVPDSRRGEEERARQRIHLDSRWWFQGQEPVPHLGVLHQAVWDDRRLNLTYRHIIGIPIQQVADPYGLVAKAGVWHLIYAAEGLVRVLPVGRVIEVESLSEGFQRPGDFDLAGFWRDWCAEHEARRVGYPAIVRVSPEMAPFLAYYFGHGVREALDEASPPDAQGWITVRLFFERLEEARARILGLGAGAEVPEPVALRLSVADHAEQIARLYRDVGEGP